MRHYLFFAVLIISSLLFLTSCSNKPDVPECDGVNDSWQRDVCYNNLAIEKHSFEICDKIHDKNENNWCISMVERAKGPREKKFLGLL